MAGPSLEQFYKNEHFSSYQEIFHDVTLRLSYTGWRSSDTGSVLHSLGTRLPRDQVISEWLHSNVSVKLLFE